MGIKQIKKRHSSNSLSFRIHILIGSWYINSILSNGPTSGSPQGIKLKHLSIATWASFKRPTSSVTSSKLFFFWYENSALASSIEVCNAFLCKSCASKSLQITSVVVGNLSSRISLLLFVWTTVDIFVGVEVQICCVNIKSSSYFAGIFSSLFCPDKSIPLTRFSHQFTTSKSWGVKPTSMDWSLRSFCFRLAAATSPTRGGKLYGSPRVTVGSVELMKDGGVTRRLSSIWMAVASVFCSASIDVNTNTCRRQQIFQWRRRASSTTAPIFGYSHGSC